MGVRSFAVICLTACAVDTAPVAPATPPPAAPTVAQMLERMAAAYAHATSYADQGVAVDVYRAPQRDHSRRLTFTTAFVRPRSFRFEYRDNGDAARAYVIWSDGSRVRTKWFVDDNKVHDVRTFGLAIAAATGVSSGTAYSVPSLLLPDLVRGRSVSTLNSAHVEGIEVVGGRKCYRVSGKISEDSRTLWIDIETYMLRKIVDRRHIAPSGGDAFDVESTVTYTPVLNGPVSAAQLAEPVDGLPGN